MNGVGSRRWFYDLRLGMVRLGENIIELEPLVSDGRLYGAIIAVASQTMRYQHTIVRNEDDSQA